MQPHSFLLASYDSIVLLCMRTVVSPRCTYELLVVIVRVTLHPVSMAAPATTAAISIIFFMLLSVVGSCCPNVFWGPQRKPTECLRWGERRQGSPLLRMAQSYASPLPNARIIHCASDHTPACRCSTDRNRTSCSRSGCPSAP